MKKYFLLLILSLFMVACSGNSPKSVASDFLTALNKGDIDEAKKYCDGPTADLLNLMGRLAENRIKEEAKGSCCTCFAPYNVRLLPLLLSKSNRFTLLFFNVRDRGAIKKSNKNFVISQKMYYLCNALSPDGGIGRRAGLKHQWSNPSRFDPGSGYKSLNVKPCKLNICRAFLLLMCTKGVLNRQQIARR